METKYEGGASPNCTIPFYNWDMGYDAKVFYCVERGSIQTRHACLVGSFSFQSENIYFKYILLID